MSFLGAGPIELLVVLLVAFIVLGPERMVDTARLMGKGIREVRRMTASLSDVIVEEDFAETGSSSGGAGDRTRRQKEPQEGPESPGEGGSQADEGPVAFRPAEKAPPEEPEEPDAPDSSDSPGSKDVT